VPRWAIVAAIIAALVPATWFGALRVFDDTSTTPGDASTDLPIPPVSPSVSTPPTTSPSSVPSKTPTATVHLPRVAPDSPHRITSGSLIDSGFDEAVTEIDSASASEVARLESRGSPGSPGTDTVYVIGEVAGDDSAFAGLPELKRGAKVSIRTDNGTMIYTVSASVLKAEDGLPADPLFKAHKAGRLVLVGIRYDASGDRLDKALVVTAQLTAARKS
jgi:hypothetical protein